MKHNKNEFIKDTGLAVTIFLCAVFTATVIYETLTTGVSSTNEKYILAVKENHNILESSDKSNIEQSLLSSVSDMDSQKLIFYVKDDDKIIQKSIVTDDDIEFIASDKNSISYTKHFNIIGSELETDNVVITYDSKSFSFN